MTENNLAACRYITTAYCTDPECRCLHRRGVVLYDGPSLEEAAHSASSAPRNYRVEIERK